MGVAYIIIRMILTLVVISIAYMINWDFVHIINGIYNPLDVYVPQSGTNLFNTGMSVVKWIIVLAVISLIWGSIKDSQIQENE